MIEIKTKKRLSCKGACCCVSCMRHTYTSRLQPYNIVCIHVAHFFNFYTGVSIENTRRHLKRDWGSKRNINHHHPQNYLLPTTRIGRALLLCNFCTPRVLPSKYLYGRQLPRAMHYLRSTLTPVSFIVVLQHQHPPSSFLSQLLLLH